MDDANFLEATEDAELAEAAESTLQSYSSGVDEIPDEIVMEIFQEQPVGYAEISKICNKP